jgi:hypothetical protein
MMPQLIPVLGFVAWVVVIVWAWLADDFDLG